MRENKPNIQQPMFQPGKAGTKTNKEFYPQITQIKQIDKGPFFNPENLCNRAIAGG